MSDCCEVLAWFAQINTYPSCSSVFRKIITKIVQKIAKTANNSINRAQIDNVAALMQSTNASLALLLLALSLRINVQ